MKKISLILFSVMLFTSCGTLNKLVLTDDQVEFLKYYSTSGKIITYYKTIPKNSDFYKEWEAIIKEMNVLSSFGPKPYKQHKKVVDSIKKIPNLSVQEKDHLINEYVDKVKIKPWTILRAVDKKYMIEQIKRYKTTKWTKINASNFNLTQSKSARKRSFPFISKDGKYALIFISDSGYREMQFFKKENEQWYLYFTSMLTIR